MSIACSIVDIAVDQARAAGAARINTVEVEVGGLAGIEVESLRFCWDAARTGLAAGAELIIHAIPGRGFCPRCERETDVDFVVALCPACEGGLRIVQGRELRVRCLNVD
ncbi:MAG TPA: hydrogenase maturation nickel metallochaperone HypA [Candidatus Krumholzibacteria bacterium]|nr:hydrogenase maturation nickel metallochaperone HypA [Candidatus Krumholzibacteria bacterium]